MHFNIHCCFSITLDSLFCTVRPWLNAMVKLYQSKGRICLPLCTPVGL